ncbi:MAG: sel1 repeat family protein [Eubacterium sp.]|nr:sel1 repeat family protein [Eubacterium sp.]
MFECIGYIYEHGIGVERNMEEALKWYSKPAEKGDEDAQYRVAYMYEKGLGVKEDKYEAIRWYFKAAEQGHKDAKALLLKNF